MTTYAFVEDNPPRRRKRRFYPADSLIAQVGRRIRALRNEQGISLREFGKLASVHPFHVMEIELGQVSANIRTLAAIAKALGVAPFDLLNHGGDDGEAGAIIEHLRRNPKKVPAFVKRIGELAKPAKAGASQ